VSQCVAVIACCCVLQSPAAYSSVLWCVLWCLHGEFAQLISRPWFVAVRCGMLQRVTVCCSMSQRVAVCGRVWRCVIVCCDHVVL